jgi:HD superfamily phosphohydrolase YqeK
MTIRELHPTIVAAAAGRLPEWARVSPRRRPHLESVSELLLRWSHTLALDDVDRARWAAAGWLHDALRDAPPEELIGEAAGYPRKVRHGPAAAALLRRDGVEDEELLEAVTFHSLGCGGLRRLGRYLFLADYLEPKRPYAPQENAVLRARLPEDERGVLRIVCARRIVERLVRDKSLRPETVDFWNELAADT